MPQFQTFNSTQVTMKVRHALPTAWTEENPILAAGEYGLEDTTFLLKIGDGKTEWNSLHYLNKLNPIYFDYLEDGTVTFSASFQALMDEFVPKHNAVVPSLTITNNPTNDTDAVTKMYVDKAVREAGVLHHTVVTVLPDPEDADPNTIYMIRNGDTYEQYMLMDGELEPLGSIVIDIQPATLTTLGGVRGSRADNHIYVTQQGFMTLNRVSTSLLYVPEGDKLILCGGDAQEV